MDRIYQARISYILPPYLRIPLFLVLLATPVILFNPLQGIPFLLLAVAGITAQEGIVLNFHTRQLKVYFSIFGIKIGKWQPMPVYNRITLVKDRELIRASSANATASHQYYTTNYTIRLYDTESHDYQIASKGTKEKVAKDAERLSKLTQIGIEDFTHA